MLALDKTDWKIIKALYHNSRMSMSQIARQSRISKAGCFYRIKRMEEEGLIQGYRTRIDSSKLGLNTYAVYLKMFDMDQETENAFIGSLLEIKELKWLVSSTGKWDMMLAVSAPNNMAFEKALSKIIHLGEKKILEYETSTVLSTRELWFSDIEHIPDELSESVETTEEIDSKDRKILDLLQKNSRIGSTSIAKDIGLTAEAIAYRIKSLLKRKIIHSFTLSLNKELLGLEWYQVQFSLNDPEQADKLLPKIIATGDAGYIVKTLGKWNFEIHLYCKNISEFREKLMKLRSLMSGSIRNYETNIILKKYSSKTFIGDNDEKNDEGKKDEKTKK